jgi:hypothetical protein
MDAMKWNDDFSNRISPLPASRAWYAAVRVSFDWDAEDIK